MREIKFRAWHKKRKVMVHFDMMTITKTYYVGYWHTKDLDGFDCELDDPNLYTDLMQYTGLKDKNGKEIYEGDIVKTFFGDNFTGEVIYGLREAGFRLYNPDVTRGLDYPVNMYAKNWEVIGNIYENPELLTTHG